MEGSGRLEEEKEKERAGTNVRRRELWHELASRSIVESRKQHVDDSVDMVHRKLDKEKPQGSASTRQGSRKWREAAHDV